MSTLLWILLIPLFIWYLMDTSKKRKNVLRFMILFIILIDIIPESYIDKTLNYIDPPKNNNEKLISNTVQDKFPKLGEIGRSDDGFEFTITKAYYIDQIGKIADNPYHNKMVDELNKTSVKKANGKFLILETTMKNGGKEALKSYTPITEFVRDSNNNKYGLSSTANTDEVNYLQHENNFGVNNFDPDLLKNVYFIFDVPRDSDIIQAELSGKPNAKRAIINIKDQIN